MILVVGSYNVDYFVVVEKLPSPGETVRVLRTFSAHGGKGSNQAVSARRLGSQVRFIGAVGSDDAGEIALKFWREESVDSSFVRVKQGVPTGKAIILVDREGRNEIAVEPGANMELSPEDVEQGLDFGRVLLTQLEIPEETVKYALERYPGLKILNPAPAVLKDVNVLGLADILTPNEVEATALAGTSEIPLAAERLARKAKVAAIVTLGPNGVLAVTRDGRRIRVEGIKVRVVDETGAGDVFNAALAVFLSRGYDLEVAIEKANRVAAHSVTIYGALGPKWEEVKDEV